MTPLAAALWFFCLVVRISADPRELNKKVGDSVLLSPDVSSVKPPIASIEWKHKGNLAFVFEDEASEPYNQFRGKATLNNTNAALMVTGLTGNFSGMYEVEVNGKQIYSIRLNVIPPVSKPTVTVVRCDELLTSCVLSCDGDITTQDQVDWRRDDKTETGLPKQLNITKERDADYIEFRCVLRNQVSEESSDPVINPLRRAPPPEEDGQKWMTGVTVFISLLTVMVVLALVHRWKAGFWFYDTEYMPWEADFWRRSETERADQADNAVARGSSNAEAAESNGTSAAREQRPHEEDGLMAETKIP